MKLISEDLVKALLDYFMTRPYGEVCVAVNELSQLKNFEEPKKPIEIKKENE